MDCQDSSVFFSLFANSGDIVPIFIFLPVCFCDYLLLDYLSEPAHLVAHQRTQHSIVVRPTVVHAISLRTSALNTRSSSVPLLYVPFRRTSFARRSFSTATPLTWNSLPPAVLNCDSISTFKSRLKNHLFSTAFC